MSIFSSRPRPPALCLCLSLLATLGLPGSSTAAGGLDPLEERLIAGVDRHLDQSVALLERTVNVNSGTENLEGVRQVGSLLRGELAALGFATRWVPGGAFGRAGHLVAERTGAGPSLLLIGHLDTVFEKDGSFQTFRRDGDRAQGPGIIDMKGGNVIMLLALRALLAADALDRMTVRVIMTGDEEAPGQPLEAARAELVSLARQSDFALGFEDGDGDPATAVISRRGSGAWRLRTTGIRAHSSQIYRGDIGSGAIYEAARILLAFHDLRDPHLTMSPGLILGGSRVDHDPEESRGTAFGKSNVIAETVLVTGDLRPFSLEQRARIQEQMRAIVAEHLPQTGAEITFRDSYPPMDPSPANRRLLEILDRASRDLGLGPVGPAHLGRLGAADISFAAPYVNAALDGLGLAGDGGHTVQERADLSTLPGQAKRAALLMLRLTREAWE